MDPREQVRPLALVVRANALLPAPLALLVPNLLTFVLEAGDLLSIEVRHTTARRMDHAHVHYRQVDDAEDFAIHLRVRVVDLDEEEVGDEVQVETMRRASRR